MKNETSQIIKAGFIVGTLDIISAFIQVFIKSGKNPLIVLKYIASAIFGKAAFADGIAMMFIGLFLHYLIAFAFTILFFTIYPRIRLLWANKIVTGIVYGLFIWAVMNLIVVPLTRIPAKPFDLQNAGIALGILIVCIGLPLSFMAGSFYKNSRIS